MNFLELQTKAKTYPIFRVADVLKWFPETRKANVLNQLNLWTKKGHIERLRKSLYVLKDYAVKDSFILANLLYAPSYISLETALHVYGMIPEIPFRTTSVTQRKTKMFSTQRYGTFQYHHIKPELFFGFQTVSSQNLYSYHIAFPEKALFDYLYLRAKAIENPGGFLRELRLSFPRQFSVQKLQEWSVLIPQRNTAFHRILEQLSLLI